MDRKKIFCWWKITLTIISLIGAVLAKSRINWHSLLDNHFDRILIKDIIYDLSVGIFSAMILVWFIDEINERVRDAEKRNREIEQIRRLNSLLQIYIGQYRLSFYCLITPVDKQDFNNVEIRTDFLLKDMQDLYEWSRILNEGVFISSIESFVKIESILKEKIETIIMDIDFTYYPSIRDHLIEFVKASINYNQKGAWLNAKNTPAGEQKLSDIVVDALKNQADDWYNEFQNGKDLSHSMILSWFALFEMLKGEGDALLKYEQEIHKLDV